MGVVGVSVARKDALDKVRGTAAYIDDIHYPRELIARAVRCPHARARVSKLDVEAARAYLGEEGAVVTAADIPGNNLVPFINDDQPFIVGDEVRYAGEAVAFVAAPTHEAAEEAASRVRVEYETLPSLVDPWRFAEQDVPTLTELAGEKNVYYKFVVKRGDCDAAFASAAHVIEGEYRTPYQEHIYLEPQGMVAVPDGSDSIVIIGSLQCPWYVQKAVSKVLGIELSRVRVIQAVTGGGFGGKEEVPSILAGQVALLTWKTKRPVRLIFDRSEDIHVTSKRHPSLVRMRSALDGDGRFVACRADVLLDAGAYSGITSPVLWRAAVHASGSYRCENVDVVARAVATNRASTGAFRGFGGPQVNFAVETQLNKLARAAGLDPLELRLRNALRPGDATATGQVLDKHCGLEKTIKKAGSKARWKAARKRTAKARPMARKRRGVGCACLHYGVSLGAAGKYIDKAGSLVQICLDGSVQVAVGNIDMGQGSETVLSQIAADGLGIGYERIRMMTPDTSLVPDSGPTVASRSTTLSGNAILDAVAKLRRSLYAVAAEKLGCRPGELRSADDKIFVRKDPARSVAFDDVVATCGSRRIGLAAQGWYEPPDTTFDNATGQGDAYFHYTFVTNVAEVEVDTRTAEVELVKVTSVYDLKAVNPQTAEGQAEGGLTQAAGWALMENMASKDGRILTDTLATYQVPGIADVPVFDIHFTPAIWKPGPFGIKGMGETPTIGLAAAITDAIYDATGCQCDELPVLPERLFEKLKTAGASDDSDVG